MSLSVIARKEFYDAGRSKLLWGVTALFVLLVAGFAYLYAQIPSLQQGGTNEALSSIGLVSTLHGPIGLLVPLIGLLLGYKAIAGEVEHGSVKLLLSFPHSRANVVLGKYIGRLSVLAVAIAAGFAVATAIVLVLYPNISPANYLVYVLVTLVFGGAYVSIGIGISSVTKSSTKAGAAILGTFVLFTMLWKWVGSALSWAVTGYPHVLRFRAPDWLLLFDRLNPSGAFDLAVRPLVNSGNVPFFPFESGVPFQFWPGFGLLVLLGWIVLPTGLGYLRFRSMDL